ncbi:MAG TPA: hypothetical protein VMH85_00415 [Terriglobales bacterium]|nr:hypothetical protein [Terriglobales bacterium]
MKKLLPALLALITLAGCSSQPSQPAPKPQPKPPEALTGRAAFQKLYVTAHGWARDAQPYRLDSQVVGDFKGHDGKAVIWSASFASPVGRSVKPYTWSGIDLPDAPARGVDPGVEDTYVATNASTQIFDVNFLKIDSDKAFEVAQKHGGEKLLTKSPNTPVFYSLDWNRSTNELTWHVIYGNNRDEAILTVAVNASSGDFLRVEK